MNIAHVSLAALVVAILVSCFTELNVGILALSLAWIVGVYVGGMPLNDVIGGFPVSLFLTLAGVTLLFSQAQLNRTLDRIAHRAVRLCRGNTGLIPVMFFILACALASMGPGNISTAALLGPMAMAVAGRAAIPAFLMIIMVGNGAQSGALSPFAPTGVIVNGLGDIQKVRIDASLMKPEEQHVVEDLVAAAYADGKKKLESQRFQDAGFLGNLMKSFMPGSS